MWVCKVHNTQEKTGLRDKYYDLGELVERNPDGTNNDGDNNPSNDEGTHDSVFSRVTNSYVDGIGQMPAQDGLNFVNFGGGPPSVGAPVFPSNPDNLPSAREVSDAVMAQGTTDIPNSFGVNEYFQFFGQILTHDMAEAGTGASGDPPYATAGLFPPIPFGRTPFEDGTAGTGPRQQINEETSFLDLSMVYGNSQAMLDLVRADLPGHAGQSAKLLLGAEGLLPTIGEVAVDAGADPLDVLRIYRPDGFGGLPDPDAVPTPAAILDESYKDLYLAGDNRVNQTTLLISQQTVWAREHNYWVDKLAPKAEKFGWSQDQLFEAARAITEAEWQHVIYDEYLPKLIGKQALESYDGYKSNVDPSIINAFTTVAFRFGHDQSSQNQQPLDEDGSAANPVPSLFEFFTLAEAFIAGANGVRTSEDIDQWIRGQLSSDTQEIDGFVVDGNRNLLFGGVGPVTDLEVFDIMRARDHGVWSYNQMREDLGLSAYASFEEFAAANNIDASSQRYLDLTAVYDNDIGKLDAIIGGLLEKKYYDSQLGETFTKIIATQFENVRDGDQLYYENRFAEDPKILADIEGTTLADILGRTTGIDHLYHDAFAAHLRISENDGTIDGSEQKDLAIGTELADIIRTYAGDDDLYGEGGRDILIAGAGNDMLWGGGDRDIFVFEKNSGYDLVQDFETRYDKLDLTEYGIDSWRDVRKAADGTADGVVIHLDDDNSVQLVGVSLGSLSSRNFIFDHDYDYGLAIA